MKLKSQTRSRAEERLKALQHISVELMATKDPRGLLQLVVNKAVELLQCDAGTLYLRYDEEHLAFEVAVNRSVDIELERSLVPVQGRGLAAYVFRSGEALCLRDVYRIANDAPYAFDARFDEFLNYRTRSTLVLPLRSSKGEALGVLQLINRKKSYRQAWPTADLGAQARMPHFTQADQKLLESFAAVASASIENAKLHENIEQLFEGFVKASVHAIESRDVATRGHSDRVAILTVELARRIHDSPDSDLRDIRFSESQIAEIRYASLLHDFGKIGVRESTLQKEEKLSPLKKERIRSRFNDFRSSAEVRVLREYLQDLLRGQRPPSELEIATMNRRIREFNETIEQHWQLVLELNQPTVLDVDKSHRLKRLVGLECRDCDGHSQPLLEPDEIANLSILRGSLTETERLEIESHVTQSFEFLRKIPWTRELAGVPSIAYAHHERLDGSGYPRGVAAIDIPVQAKIMAITDVYDALTANDRPYKPALPFEKALAIIERECLTGKLDKRFFDVFREARVFECPELVRFNNDFGRKAA